MKISYTYVALLWLPLVPAAVAAIHITVSALGCTPQQAKSAADVIVSVVPEACKIAEELTDSPVVMLICAVLDAKTGEKVGEQRVAVTRLDSVYQRLKYPSR